MASLHSVRSLRPSLLSLPPNLRTTIYHHRTFSSTPKPQSTLVDIATAGPTFIIDSLHNLGIPWHTSIPLTAILIRSTFVYYTSTLPARKNAQTTNSLVPLINAWTKLQQNSEADLRIGKEMRQRGINPSRYYLYTTWRRFGYFNRAMWRYGGMFGLSGWRRYGGGLANFGVLIAFSEAIRLKCGTRQGLLGLILSPIEWTGRKVAPGAFEKVPDPAEQLAARIEKIQEAQGGELVDLSEHSLKPTPLSGPDTTSPYFDPTLQTEGLAWCPDLTLPDPAGALPFVVFAAITTTVLFQPIKQNTLTSTLRAPGMGSDGDPQFQFPVPRDASPESAATLSTPQPKLLPTFLRRRLTGTQLLGLIFAYVFGLVAHNLPAAILLYFIPSILVGWVQARWLDVKFPVRPAVQPCKRPLRMKKWKEWS